MRHITGLVRPGGLFVTAALRRSAATPSAAAFPSANVDESDLEAVLARDFQDVTVSTRALTEHRSQGYSGIVLAAARRRTAAPPAAAAQSVQPGSA